MCTTFPRQLTQISDRYETSGKKKNKNKAEPKGHPRVALLRTHPDKGSDADVSGAESRAAFLQVQEAWRVLGDPQLRYAYDERRMREEDDDDSDFVNFEATLSDMQACEGGQYEYACRCGDAFALEQSDLPSLRAEGALLLQCPSCSLVLKVSKDLRL